MPRKRNPYAIYLRGKTYYVKYRDPETGEFQSGKSTGMKTKKAATTWADKHQGMVETKPSKLLIPFLEGLLADGSSYLKYESDRKGPPSETDLSHKRSKMRLHIIPALKEFRVTTIDSLTLEKLEKMQSYLVGSGLGPKTMNESMHLLHAGIKWAIREGLVATDPFLGLKPFVYIPKKRGTLIYEEVKALWDSSIPNEVKSLIFFPILTGMRTGEVQALQYGDLQKNRIHIVRTFDSREGFKGPKGSRLGVLKERYTCLPPSLLKLIDTNGKKKDDLVFPPNNESRALKNDIIIERFHNGVSEIGITLEDLADRNIDYYSGRHFFNTFLIERGFPLPTIALLMGHTGVGNDINPMTINYYAAQTDFDKINDAFEVFLNPKKPRKSKQTRWNEPIE